MRNSKKLMICHCFQSYAGLFSLSSYGMVLSDRWIILGTSLNKRAMGLDWSTDFRHYSQTSFKSIQVKDLSESLE